MAFGSPFGSIPYGATEELRSDRALGLEAETLRKLAQLLTAETDDFNELVRLSGLNPRLHFRNLDLSGMNMAGADLRDFDFSHSDLRNVDVTDSVIAGTIFKYAELSGTDLAKASGLNEADLDLAIIQDASFAPEMIVVPRGAYMRGSPDGEENRRADEGPQHRVTIAHRFAVGRFPVTFEEYDQFIAGTGGSPPSDRGWGRGRRPVIQVLWEDAKAYVRWLSRRTGQFYRLMSEAEWEYVCRAGSATPYWWGDQISSADANYGRNIGRTTEVGSYAPNPWGLFDLHGNVWEWVEDCWNESYDRAPSDGTAWTSGDCSHRVVRGGSWVDYPSLLRAASRLSDEHVYKDEYLGACPRNRKGLDGMGGA